MATVLEGSVRRAGNRLRVNTQLINADNGFHLWSERYDRDMDDVFAVQDEIAQSVVAKPKVRLLGEQGAPLVAVPTDNLEAYNLYLKGRHHLGTWTGQSLERSVECFTQALALESSYAQAFASMADAQTLRAILSFAAPVRLMPLAKEAASKAIALDESLAEAHYAQALVLDFYEWDWPSAEAAFRRALELNSGDPMIRSRLADLLSRQGRAEEAAAAARQAVALDPLPAASRFFLAMALVSSRRFDEALTEAEAAIELEPRNQSLYTALGWAKAGLGRHDEAVGALRQATRVAPDDPHSDGHLAVVLGNAGNQAGAKTIQRNLQRRRDEEFVSGFLMAQVSVALGDHEQAIVWLETAAQERDTLMPYLNVWPARDPLRADPASKPSSAA